MIKPEKVELMAPVGSFESLAAAIKAGADSIYFGVTQLNMRARSANNMTIEDLKKIAEICHENKVKAYLTVNTLLYDHDLKIMRMIIDAAKSNGIDAVIVSDFAALQYANQIGQPAHISTQLSISNYETVKFFAGMTNRVVLARELTLDQIKGIYNKIQEEQLLGNEGRLMEIEAFIHGALCVAQSGRCFMSLHTYNSSANRGACKQNCRAKYKVTDVDTGKELIIDNQYVMSASDICTIDFIDKLLESGISVFKVEGRGRSPEYVDTVIRTYKQAIQDVIDGNYTAERVEEYYKKLETVYNRGLSKGNYYLGVELGSYATFSGSQATKEKEYIGKVTHIFPKAGVIEVTVEAATLKVGDDFLIMGATTGVYSGKVTEMRDVNKEVILSAGPGAIISFPVSETIRLNDKVYRFFDRTEFQEHGSKKNHHKS